jgi:osmotically-inducible protein OsmY
MKTDSQLQHDVLEELKWEPQVDHSQIGVTAKGGVVTLTGFVPNYAQKLAAEKAARRVQGVAAIAQEIEVRFPSDPKTSDAEIAQRILDVFRWDVIIPDDKFAVEVEHGYVTLTGKADWNYQKQAAGKAAGRISGVKLVTNLIEVAAVASSYDIRERILSAFKRSSAIDANAINIKVEGGTVKLSGRVHAWNERKLAENAAWSTAGVTRVEDEIVLA